MSASAARELLSSPLVRVTAPWCAPLDNIQLGIALLTQPWTGLGGLRRSELQSHLVEMADDLPLGNIYFQRVSRSVIDLEGRCVLEGRGRGRNRRFTLTPAGFGAVILNLNVLTADPTIDGSEFEFKRELVAAWHLMLHRLRLTETDLTVPEAAAEFFRQVVELTVFDRHVIDDDTFIETFDILRLIDRQRVRVDGLRCDAEEKLAMARQHIEAVGVADLSQIAGIPAVRDNPALLEALRAYVTSGIPLIAIEAKSARYKSYLAYLDDLTAKYSESLNLVDLSEVRRVLKGA